MAKTLYDKQATANDYNSAFMYHYDGSTYTRLMRHFALNDYNSYSTGTTFFYPLGYTALAADRYGLSRQ